MKPKTVGRISGKTPDNSPYQHPYQESSHQVAGLQADSIILTLQGERPISDLAVGDRVITRDSGTALVRSVRSHKVTTRAVRILAGSLGHTRPECDVTLPAGQPVLVRDWRARALFNVRQAMVAAHRLIDGEFITDAGEQEMTLYELEFEAPHILYVDGLEVASDATAIAPGDTDKAA